MPYHHPLPLKTRERKKYSHKKQGVQKTRIPQYANTRTRKYLAFPAQGFYRLRGSSSHDIAPPSPRLREKNANLVSARRTLDVMRGVGARHGTSAQAWIKNCLVFYDLNPESRSRPNNAMQITRMAHCSQSIPITLRDNRPQRHTPVVDHVSPAQAK